MGVSSINLSKNNLHSEDSICYTYVNKRYIIIANADGNGSMGQKSAKVLYNFNNQYELSSLIGITTDYYINKLIKDVHNIVELHGVVTDEIQKKIHYIIKEAKKDTRPTCFCFLLTILDLKDLLLYSYGIGDCKYAIYNKKDNNISYHTLQKTNNLTFNGRGSALISCPNFISNQNNENIEVQTQMKKLPPRFIFLQYSDGLDYDIAVPCHMIESKMGQKMVWDQSFYNNPHIIHIHEKLKKEILKKDKPCSQYTKYNLTNNELLNILTSNKNTSSVNILSYIIQHAVGVLGDRKKIDDISIAVFTH